MADDLTLKIGGDAAGWMAALAQGGGALTAFVRQGEKDAADLQAKFRELTGGEVIAGANRYAEAVQAIGGASKLTASEKAKLNAAVGEAIEKYKALGVEAPTALRKLHTETEQIPKKTSLAQTAIEKIGPAMAAAFTVTAVTAAVSKFVDFASRTVEVADRVGMTTDAVQALTLAFGGNSDAAEKAAKGTSELGRKLVDGDAGAVNAVRRLGFTLDELKAKSPDELFLAVADAIAQIPDPAERALVAQRTFGKAGLELLPELNGNLAQTVQRYRDMGAVIDEETLRSAKTLGEQWGVLKASGGALLSAVIAPLIPALSGVASAATAVAGSPLVKWLVETATVLPRLREQWERFKQGLEEVGLVAGKMPDAAGPATAAVKSWTQAIQERAAAPLTRALQDEDRITKELTVSAERLIEQHEKEQQHAEKIASLREQLFGRDIITKARDYVTALGDISNATQLSTDKKKELHEAVTAAIAAYERLGERAPANLRAVAAATQPAIENTFRLGQSWAQAKAPLEDAGQELQNIAAGLEGNGNLISRSVEETAELSKATEDWAKKHGAVLSPALKQTKTDTDDLRSSTQTLEQAWLGGLDNISDAFAQLAQIGGQGLDGLIGKIGELIGLMNVGAQAGGQLAGIFRNKDEDGNILGFGQPGAGFNLDAFRKGGAGGQFTTGSILTGAIGAAPGILSGIGAIGGATDVAGRGNRAFRGGLAGFGVGMQLGGPIGGAIGAGVGALVGALRNPAWEDVMKRVGHEWGVSISEETGRAIADTAKELFKGDRQAAEIFSMDKILGESGGLNEANIDRMTGKLHDVFSMIEMGKFTTEQATEVLEKNFGTFADYYTRTGDLVSEEFAHIIQLNDEFGTKSQAVRDFITGQLDQGASGLASWLQTGATALESMSAHQAQLTDLERQYASASAADRPRIKKEIDAVTLALTEEKKIHAAIGVTTQETAEAAGAALGAMFAEYVEGGATTTEALEKIGPAADGLRRQLQQAGLDGGEAFAEITRLADIAKDRVAGPALDAVSGLNTGLKSLHNTGLLNQTMFAGLTSQVARTRDTIVAQGHSGDDALRLMQPTLQTIWELQQKFGYSTDAATQELLTQAEAAGLVGDTQKDAQEKAADAMQTAADKMALVADSLAKVIGGADRTTVAFGRVKDAVNKIPRRVEVEVEGRYNPPDVPEGGYAVGTRGRHGRWFMDFGPGYNTRVHGLEAIVPFQDRFDFALATLAEIQSSVGARSGMLPFPSATDGGSSRGDVRFGDIYIDLRGGGRDGASARELALVIKRELEQEFLTKVPTGVRS